DYVQYKVEPLLIRQSGYAPYQGALRVFRQPKHLQQITLAVQLAAELRCRIPRGDEWIDFGIPFVVVDPVQNSVQIGSPGSQQALESLAIFGSLDFPAVVGADGRDSVRKNETALE